MSLYCLFASLLLLPRVSGRAQHCEAGTCPGDDANVFLQTSASLSSPKKVSMRQLLASAASSDDSADADEVGSAAMLPRPNVGKGPDHVSFGMMGKALYGVDIEQNHFTIDVVITLKWMDQRNLHLIPKGAANVTLSQAEAEKSIWMPEVSVTNLKISKLDVISTAVTLLKNGDVLKVQRVTVIVMDNYQLKEFPFDMQDLEVKIASTQYMSGALQLVPDENPQWTGVPTKLFEGSGFALKDWSLFQVDDNNGLLQKSRGVLSMKVQRVLTSYMNQNFIPGLYVIALSCSVFYFPFSPMFIMPRLTMSVITYLTYTNIADKSDKALPKNAPNTWNDVLTQNVEMIMVVTACLNIYVEMMFNSFKEEEVATKINFECKLLAPLLNVLAVTVIMICGACHAEQSPVDITIKVLIALTVLAYVVFNEWRRRTAMRKKQELAEAEEARQAAADKDDTASQKSAGDRSQQSAGPAPSL